MFKNVVKAKGQLWSWLRENIAVIWFENGNKQLVLVLKSNNLTLCDANSFNHGSKGPQRP